MGHDDQGSDFWDMWGTSRLLELMNLSSAGTDILAAVATHGPIMHQFRAVVSEVVQHRDSAFADHRARARMTVCPRRPSGNLLMRARCFPRSRPSRTRFTWSIRKGASDS